MGRKNKNASNILNAATCEEVKASIPFFIRINELPHTSESATNMIQLLSDMEFLYTWQRYQLQLYIFKISVQR